MFHILKIVQNMHVGLVKLCIFFLQKHELDNIVQSISNMVLMVGWFDS